MMEEGIIRGSSVLRYCSTCKNNMWHKIDMCGKCGTTNTAKCKERCRCCGGMFDSLAQDHPGLQGQCETCVENYEKEKIDVSNMIDPMDVAGLCPSRLGINVPSGTSDMTYRCCCSCGKIVNGSAQQFRNVEEPFMCIECRNRADPPVPNAALEPDNSHYTKGGIEPWTYIQANNLNFFEGSVVKYVTRWKHKNGIEDLRKARVYIDELIRQEESK